MKSNKQPGAQDAGGGDDLFFNASQNKPASINLGQGDDTVHVRAGAGISQVRLTFTSAEVGNLDFNDSGSQANQDGGLAVRLQVEDKDGGLKGTEHRFDDEGIRFVADGNLTFDVRDLVSGAERGSLFSVVNLGTVADNKLSEKGSTLAAYINGGLGNDNIIGGTNDDFLVGGAGNDVLNGAAGNDTFIGGAGNDAIKGGAGNDTANYNVSTDGVDKMNLGIGDDVVNVSAAEGVTQVRLTFTSSEVGDGRVQDGKAGDNQDGGLAVRIQAENAAGDAVGTTGRADDEGITFVAAAGVTFDVRDLVSGAARGDGFQSVTLGAANNDVVDHTASVIAEYMNGGSGNDTLTGGSGDDFLVGGIGGDTLNGGDGSDSFIGGVGDDTINGGAGNDTVIVNVSTDGADTVDLGAGLDTVEASATLRNGDAAEIRLTFNGDSVGNGDASNPAGLAVEMQAETRNGALTGSVGHYDDEGVTFVATGGSTFDVRDGSQSGSFTVVALGSDGLDTLDQSAATGSVYLNGGLLSDTLIGGAGDDVLIGGGGRDYLNGGAGDDTLIGGDGLDMFQFSDTPGDDTIVDFRSGKDLIDLSALGITEDDVTIRTVNGDTFVFVDDHAANDFTITATNSVVTVDDLVF